MRPERKRKSDARAIECKPDGSFTGQHTDIPYTSHHLNSDIADTDEMKERVNFMLEWEPRWDAATATATATAG